MNRKFGRLFEIEDLGKIRSRLFFHSATILVFLIGILTLNVLSMTVLGWSEEIMARIFNVILDIGVACLIVAFLNLELRDIIRVLRFAKKIDPSQQTGFQGDVVFCTKQPIIHNGIYSHEIELSDQGNNKVFFFIDASINDLPQKGERIRIESFRGFVISWEVIHP